MEKVRRIGHDVHGIQFEEVARVVFLNENFLAVVATMVDAITPTVLKWKRSGAWLPL